jgi:nitroreductase
MDLLSCLEERQSCRAFVQKKVSKGLLEKVLKAANRSPSYMNSQPWELFVVTGSEKDALAKQLYDQAAAGALPAQDLPPPKDWPAALERRFKEHRLRRFKAIGVDPENAEQVREGFLKNFQFFNAPCVVFVGMERSAIAWSVFDLGLFVHGFLLAAHAEGLACCIQASVMAYPDTVRKELQIPDNICLPLAISVGYPDRDSRANQCRSLRRDVDEFVRWYGPWT